MVHKELGGGGEEDRGCGYGLLGWFNRFFSFLVFFFFFMGEALSSRGSRFTTNIVWLSLCQRRGKKNITSIIIIGGSGGKFRHTPPILLQKLCFLRMLPTNVSQTGLSEKKKSIYICHSRNTYTHTHKSGQVPPHFDVMRKHMHIRRGRSGGDCSPILFLFLLGGS